MRERQSWARALDVQMETLEWYKTPFARMVTIDYIINMYELGAVRNKRSLTVGAQLLIEQGAKHEADLIPQTLWRADTCFVTSDMLHLALQAAHDMPNDEIAVDFRNLMTPIGFMLLEEPIYGVDVAGIPVGFHAWAWNATEVERNPVTGEQEKELQMWFFSDNFDPDAGNEEFVKGFIECDQPIPKLAVLHRYRMFDGHIITHTDGQGYEIVEEVLKVFYALQLLAQQTIGTPMQMRPDRATRKRMARKYNENDRMITLITLRRKSVKHDNEEPAKVEWTRRWLVRGHWRRQYYPKTKTHDWVYIFEHIKGPDDKPFIPTERRIFDFRR